MEWKVFELVLVHRKYKPYVHGEEDIMRKYRDMSREELLIEKASLEKQFEAVKARRLKLDMSRGKPSRAQLDECSEFRRIF